METAYKILKVFLVYDLRKTSIPRIFFLLKFKFQKPISTDLITYKMLYIYLEQNLRVFIPLIGIKGYMVSYLIYIYCMILIVIGIRNSC